MRDSVDLVLTCGSICKHTIYEETEGHAYGCVKGLAKQALKRDVVSPFLADENADSFVKALADVKGRFAVDSDKLPALDEDVIDDLLNQVMEEEQNDNVKLKRAFKNRERRSMNRKQADDVTLLINGNFAAGDLFVTFTLCDEILAEISGTGQADKILTEFLKFGIDREIKKYGFESKWLYVTERDRIHYHAVISAAPLPESKMPKKRDKIVTDIKTQRAILRRVIAEKWGSQYGFVDIRAIRNLSKYKKALAAYISKEFGGDRPAYAHRYHKSHNLVRIERETNASDPKQLGRYIATYKSSGEIALREQIETELPDGRCLLEDPEVCIADGYAPYVRYFEIDGSPALEDEIKEVAIEDLTPLGVDLHIRLGDPRKGIEYVDSELNSVEYSRTRGAHQRQNDLAAKLKAERYLRENPIHPAIKIRPKAARPEPEPAEQMMLELTHSISEPALTKTSNNKPDYFTFCERDTDERHRGNCDYCLGYDTAYCQGCKWEC